jgi:GNAT superfamily N-acetyltransferase
MKSNAVKIRMAGGNDVEELASLLSELFTIEKDFIINRDNQIKALSMLIGNENTAVIVAEVDSRVIGMVTGQLVISTAEGGYSVLLEDMSVTERFRYKGVGRFLLEALVAWGKERSAVRIQLLADRTNSSAIKFYSANGFSASRMEGMYRKL